MLTPIQIELLIIIGIALPLIVSNLLRADLVALLVLLALGLSGILPTEQALAGFSRPAVLTIVGLFVITTALERAGVVQWLAERLAYLSGGSELRMIGVFMGAGALLSLGMNNIAAGAVLLPAAVNVARRSDIPASKLLMPLSFGTLLGGMATLFTTANIVISGALQAQNQPALTMLDFLIPGGLTTLLGILYMLTLGRRWLPLHDSVGRAALARPDLTQTYKLSERLWEVRVAPDSPLVEQRLGESVIGSQLGATVVGIWHGREAKIPPSPSDVIAANDILLVLGREDRVRQLAAQHTEIGRENGRRSRADLSVYLTEVVIGPRSPGIGATLKNLRFRTKFGLTAVALWREGRAYRTDIGDFTLQAGDALLMVGSPQSVRVLAEEQGYIVLDTPAGAARHPRRRALLTLLITLIVLLLSAFGLVPTAEAMLAGAAALVLTGCINMEEAYQAIEWRVVVLIAGMLPIGTALLSTGLADLIGDLFTRTLVPAGPLMVVAGMYVFAALVTQLVGGQVTALLIGPIAVTAAVHTGVSPTVIGVVVSMGCSAAFLTPIAHPVNVLMMGPGGYSFNDFFRVGLGMLLVCVVALLALSVFYWGL